MGSSPISRLRRPFTRVWEYGASMIAFTTVGPPSTSPQPVMPASVLIFTSSASWQLLVRAWISGMLK